MRDKIKTYRASFMHFSVLSAGLGYEVLSLYFNREMLVGGINSCWMSFCIITNLSFLTVGLAYVVAKGKTIGLSDMTLLLGGVTMVLTVLMIFVGNSNRELLVLISLLIFLIIGIYMSKYCAIVDIYSHLVQIHVCVNGAYYMYVAICNGTIPIDENTVGLSLSFSLGCVVALNDIRNKPDSRYTAFRYVYLLFLIAGLFYIKSRIGIMAVGIVLLPMFKKRNIRLLLLVCMIGAIALFYSKKESTLGRCFIYSTSVNMIKENPSLALMGGGKGYFEKNYMLCQAKALVSADIDVKRRADNIRHPLNEYLFLTIEYGGLILLIAISCMWFLIKKTNSEVLRWSMIVIAIFAFFSYPLKYPMSWMVLAFAVSSVACKGKGCLNNRCVYLFGIVPLYLFVTSVMVVSYYFNWRKAYDCMEIGDMHKAECYYWLIREKLNGDDMFLYNYAKFLSMNKKFKQALEIVADISVNDYDTELLKGELYRIQERYHEAIEHYTMAHRMCPNRIIPVYALYTIYKNKSDARKQKYWGLKAITMPLKVYSKEVEYIKLQIKKEICV